MSFDLNDLPEDGAIWRSPDGWVVGDVYYDDMDQEYRFVFQGRGATIEDAKADAREREEKHREAMLQQDLNRMLGTNIGRPPETAQEHLTAAKLILESVR